MDVVGGDANIHHAAQLERQSARVACAPKRAAEEARYARVASTWAHVVVTPHLFWASASFACFLERIAASRASSRFALEAGLTEWW